MNALLKYKKILLLVSLIFFTRISAEELPLKSGDVETLPNFDCLIEPGKIVDVGSPVSGIIAKVYAERGDMVKLGQPLSRLNSAVEQAALELARTRANSTVEIELLHENAEFSKRVNSRKQELFSKSVISGYEMDRFETEQNVDQMKERQAISNNTLARLEFLRAEAVLKQC